MRERLITKKVFFTCFYDWIHVQRRRCLVFLLLLRTPYYTPSSTAVREKRSELLLFVLLRWSDEKTESRRRRTWNEVSATEKCERKWKQEARSGRPERKARARELWVLCVIWKALGKINIEDYFVVCELNFWWNLVRSRVLHLRTTKIAYSEKSKNLAF